MNQTEYYKRRKETLEAEIGKLKREINKMPPGCLTIYTRQIKGKDYHTYYKEVMIDNERLRQYIPKERLGDAKLMARKTYKCRLLKDKENELKCIDYYLNHRTDERFSEMLYPPSPYSILLSDKASTLSAWEAEPYEKSTDHPEHLIIKAPKGEFVRSKSEAMIAQSLFTKNIPYRYENVHNISGYPIATDFTIMHPKTCKIILWEHFGLSDKPNYQQRIQFKLDKYLRAGYLPGHDLILTFEDALRPLNFLEVEDLIEKHFS